MTIDCIPGLVHADLKLVKGVNPLTGLSLMLFVNAILVGDIYLLHYYLYQLLKGVHRRHSHTVFQP